MPDISIHHFPTLVAGSYTGRWAPLQDTIQGEVSRQRENKWDVEDLAGEAIADHCYIYGSHDRKISA